MAYICTKEAPWNPTIPTPVQHPDAEDDKNYDHYDSDRYTCPHCGLVFVVELPE